jgi:hypothetical protein
MEYISDGVGFASRIYRNTIIFDDDTSFSYIVKIPTWEILRKLENDASQTEEVKNFCFPKHM